MDDEEEHVGKNKLYFKITITITTLTQLKIEEHFMYI